MNVGLVTDALSVRRKAEMTLIMSIGC